MELPNPPLTAGAANPPAGLLPANTANPAFMHSADLKSLLVYLYLQGPDCNKLVLLATIKRVETPVMQQNQLLISHMRISVASSDTASACRQ